MAPHGLKGRTQRSIEGFNQKQLESHWEKLERRYLAEILRATGGRIAEAAKRAGVNPRSIFAKMKAHKLRKEDFR